ncbi:hypothetical protein HAX54_037842, partial [Datura stramonium]|nr:hypothetical protein [Datura stramonium]
ELPRGNQDEIAADENDRDESLPAYSCESGTAAAGSPTLQRNWRDNMISTPNLREAIRHLGIHTYFFPIVLSDCVDRLSRVQL